MIDHVANEFSEVVQMGNQAYQMVKEVVRAKLSCV
jgi:hypothetical protein